MRYYELELLKVHLVEKKSLKLKFTGQFDKISEYILGRLVLEHGWDSFQYIMTAQVWRLFYSCLHIQMQDRSFMPIQAVMQENYKSIGECFDFLQFYGAQLELQNEQESSISVLHRLLFGQQI